MVNILFSFLCAALYHATVISSRSYEEMTLVMIRQKGTSLEMKCCKTQKRKRYPDDDRDLQ